MDISNIGDYIKAQRKVLGITQSQLADDIGVSPQAVSKWERGENLPDVTLLPLLARLLGTTVESILNRGDPQQKENKELDVANILENMQDFLKLNALQKDGFVDGFIKMVDYDIYLDEMMPYLGTSHKTKLLEHILKTRSFDILETITFHLNNDMKEQMVGVLIKEERLDIVEDIIPILNRKQRDAVVDHFESIDTDIETIENFLPFFDKRQVARLARKMNKEV
ncbi:MAG: helix-turn-helix domain-containing protein [Defluviitaleaceae bacterium]|nr:helix-turn-helix domain-containing protein [Defluviitaleaceae bacterium]